MLRIFYLDNYFKDKVVWEKNDLGIWVLFLKLGWYYIYFWENRYFFKRMVFKSYKDNTKIYMVFIFKNINKI